MISDDGHLARIATNLLLQVKSGQAGAEEAAYLYDELLFEFLRKMALRRGRYMAMSAAGALGVGPTLGPPAVRSADLEFVAAEAAERALIRAKAAALRFDPERGDGASWAVGALGIAYLDVARSVTRSRRLLGEVPLEPEWVEHPSLTHADADPAHVAEVRDRLDRVLASLSDIERKVVLARHQYGLSYREIALYLFGDENQTKVVDRTLQNALGRLRAADAEDAAQP